MTDTMYDVMVVGAGPVGLFGLYCAGLHHLKTAVIERLSRIGGQLEYLYPEKPIYDVGGFVRVSGRELIERLNAQAFQYPADCFLGQPAAQIRRDGSTWIIHAGTAEYRTKTLIITAGLGEFDVRRYGNPAIDQYEGRGLYYRVERLAPFSGQRVLVVGGGDSAADWALAVADKGAQVTLIHRRQTFQCHADSVARLRSHPNISMITECELLAIHGTDKVESVTLHNRAQRVANDMTVDAVIVAIGVVANTERYTQWGLTMDQGAIEVKSTMETNLPGIFAAGDVVTYSGKVKLIATGFGEVATAVESARRLIQSC